MFEGIDPVIDRRAGVPIRESRHLEQFVQLRVAQLSQQICQEFPAGFSDMRVAVYRSTTEAGRPRSQSILPDRLARPLLEIHRGGRSLFRALARPNVFPASLIIITVCEQPGVSRQTIR